MSGDRLTVLSQEETQSSKLSLLSYAVISSSDHVCCGVKPEQQLGQVVILSPWRSVNIFDGMLFPWTINSTKYLLIKIIAGRKISVLTLERRKGLEGENCSELGN